MRFDYTYTALSQVASVIRYSDLAGATTVALSLYTYDADGRTTNIKTTSGSGSVLANDTYTYDAASRDTSKVEDGTTTSYSYDAASQLTQDGSNTFSYDTSRFRTCSDGSVPDTGRVEHVQL